jgi:hypothetical protein
MLNKFKNTDIQDLKEEINNLKSLLAKFSNLEQKLKDDIVKTIKNVLFFDRLFCRFNTNCFNLFKYFKNLNKFFIV